MLTHRVKTTSANTIQIGTSRDIVSHDYLEGFSLGVNPDNSVPAGHAETELMMTIEVNVASFPQDWVAEIWIDPEQKATVIVDAGDPTNTGGMRRTIEIKKAGILIEQTSA